MRVNINFGVAFDIEHAFEIQDVQFAINPECNGARFFPPGNAIVEKLVINNFVLAQCPGEKQPRDPLEGFNIVIEQIVDRFKAPNLKTANPGALNRCLRGRDHKRQVDCMTKTGQ